MASAQDWRQLEGSVIHGSVRLHELVTADPHPVFHARATEGADPELLMVRFWPDNPLLGSVLDRHREAQYFDHPSLLRCHGAGTMSVLGHDFVYAVYEAPDTLLSDFLQRGARTPAEVRVLGRHLIDGLIWLHDQDFVYCNLGVTTVALKGDRWKLADYSQLRVAGAGYGRETRRLLANMPSAPPEAFEGYVTPGWDTWSLAHLMRAALLGLQSTRDRGTDRPTRSQGRADIPEPFAAITSSCLVADVSQRCRLQEIAQRLASEFPEQPAHAEESVTAEESVQPPIRTEEAVPARTGAAPPPSFFEEPAVSPTPVSSYIEESPAVPEWRPAGVFAEQPSGKPRTAVFRRYAILGAAAIATGILLGALVTGSRQPSPVTTAPVTDERPSPVQTSTGARGTEQTSSRSRLASRSPAETQAEINDLLANWVHAYRARDLNTHMASYAPRLDRFFLKRNVMRETVRSIKAQDLQAAGQVRRYEVANMQTTMQSGGYAVVTFDKTYEFAGGAGQSGKVRSELRLRKIDGVWRIAGERDLKVYWQNAPARS